MRRQQSAFDASSLLAVQADAPTFVEAHRLLRDLGLFVVATPSVLQKLEYIRSRIRSEFSSAMAQGVLSAPGRLGLLMDPARTFSDTQREVVDIHVDGVIERGIVSAPQRGVLTAIMEAAYLDCSVFVTTDERVLEKRQALTASLVGDCGMRAIYIFSAAEIVQFFSQPS